MTVFSLIMKGSALKWLKPGPVRLQSEVISGRQTGSCSFESTVALQWNDIVFRLLVDDKRESQKVIKRIQQQKKPHNNYAQNV